MSKIKVLFGAVALVALAGCNSTISDRTLNRTATGAALGAAGSVIVGGSLLKGAVVGGAVGAITSKNQLEWN